MEQMHAVHEQIATAMLASGTVTADQLAPLVTQEEQLRSQLDSARINTMLQIRALLTPDQLAQAAATHAKLAALHEQEHAIVHASDSAAAPAVTAEEKRRGALPLDPAKDTSLEPSF